MNRYKTINNFVLCPFLIPHSSFVHCSLYHRPVILLNLSILTSLLSAIPFKDCIRVCKLEMRIDGEVENQVAHLAKLAAECGLDGIVCSAADLPAVKQFVPKGFEIITPGIRPAGADSQDQKRVATPQSAIENGATVLVIGRAITGAQNPALAAQEILNSICIK